MAQSQKQPAGGQQKKLPKTGDLIITKDGIPLIVLGRPKGLTKMLKGALVVLTQDGTTALHVLDTNPAMPDFIQPWRRDWEAIKDDCVNAQPPAARPRPRRLKISQRRR